MCNVFVKLFSNSNTTNLSLKWYGWCVLRFTNITSDIAMVSEWTKPDISGENKMKETEYEFSI